MRRILFAAPLAVLALAACTNDGEVSSTLPPLRTTVTGDSETPIAIDSAPEVIIDDTATPGGIPLDAGDNAWQVAAMLEPHGVTLTDDQVACLDGLAPFDGEVTSVDVDSCLSGVGSAWLDVDAAALVGLADASDAQVACVEAALGDQPSMPAYEAALIECEVPAT